MIGGRSVMRENIHDSLQNRRKEELRQIYGGRDGRGAARARIHQRRVGLGRAGPALRGLHTATDEKVQKSKEKKKRVIRCRKRPFKMTQERTAAQSPSIHAIRHHSDIKERGRYRAREHALGSGPGRPKTNLTSKRARRKKYSQDI